MPEDFTQWANAGVTIDPDVRTAPDGTTTADKITETATNSNHPARRNFAALPAGAVQFSAFLAAAERTCLTVLILSDLGGYATVHFDLATGTFAIGRNQLGVSASIHPAGDYHLVTVSLSSWPGGSGYTDFRLTNKTSVAAIGQAGDSYLGVAGSGIYAWGAKLAPVAQAAYLRPNLPDLRGEFVRGWDGGRGADPGRVFGSAQGDALQDHSHLSGAGVPTNNDDARGLGGRFGTVPLLATNKYRMAGEAAGDALGLTSGVFAPATATPPTTAVKPPDYSAALGGRASNETRPRNIALLPCIRAYASVVNVPGQADLDNILQQTQVQVDDALDRVVGDATAAAEAKVAWKRVGKVPVGTGAAVTLTGLDLTKETKFIVSYVKNSGTSNSELRLRASEDGGASWLPTWASLTVSANWNSNVLRGALELFSDAANGKIIAWSYLSGAAGASERQYAPAEVATSSSPVFTPDCDTVELHWSAGNFAATGASAPETDCIIIYQRG